MSKHFFTIFPMLAVAIGVSLAALADVFLKKSGFHPGVGIVVGLVLYALVAFPVAYAFKYISFGSLFIIWEAADVFLGVILGTVLFHEALSLQRLVAMALALGAMWLGYQ